MTLEFSKKCHAERRLRFLQPQPKHLLFLPDLARSCCSFAIDIFHVERSCLKFRHGSNLLRLHPAKCLSTRSLHWCDRRFRAQDLSAQDACVRRICREIPLRAAGVFRAIWASSRCDSPGKAVERVEAREERAADCASESALERSFERVVGGVGEGLVSVGEDNGSFDSGRKNATCAQDDRGTKGPSTPRDTAALRS